MDSALEKKRENNKVSIDDFELYTPIQVTPEEFADLCNTIGIKFQKEPPVC